MGDADVVRVDSASATNLKHMIDRLSVSAPTLQGHHEPSEYKTLDMLEHTSFERLQQDEDGASFLVWSIFLRPFGMTIAHGMKIAIKEPFLGQCPTGDLAICVHHPTDCILVDSSSPTTKPPLPATPSCSTHHIAIRPSSLGGRGVFATAPIGAGGLVVLEKALALSDSVDAATYGNGIDGILEGERSNGRKLALLQQVVDKVCNDGELQQKLFELHAGQRPPVSPDDSALPAPLSTAAFDTYRALAIVKHNAHTIIPGNTSDHHDISNKAARPNHPSAHDQTPGIWLQASMFNHSCLPNCTWAWTGDLFVARANRDIAADEELTVAYVPTSYDYEKRKSILRSSNDFECLCPLCEADKTAARTPEVQEAVTKAQRLPKYVKGGSHEERVREAAMLVRSAVAAYPRSIYTDPDGAELPCIQLAEPFYHLAHAMLDRAKNGHDWIATSSDMRNNARLYFTACVEVGLGYKLVLDQQSPYCELILMKHSQPRPIGVLAFMGLAELAFIDGDKIRCRALKACAKKLYGIWYGEDASFKKQHLYYKCKAEPPEKGKVSSSKEWEELKAAMLLKSTVPPKLSAS
ncbi:hypothetical protein M409DRAFT_68857 [Zasmidium cellare ATCC 36951]|uniref:SET domain-containing protein n=1 Tax=Zasmidium cellare ATCC 36951 TaxID=1080233 RepID=A0A6A6CAG9_ZASCE|nr:uncharacterized protein M409DRAFT_68857 [Zasmidium cellare ATCC 36951]KAF2162892.1 hypothetical protein M409DRAFT_68857 [Zasmidium cellare ATCC 36951]